MRLTGGMMVVVLASVSIACAQPPIDVEIYPAVPASLSRIDVQDSTIRANGGVVTIANASLSVDVDVARGTIRRITNRLADETYETPADLIAISYTQGQTRRHWQSGDTPAFRLQRSETTAGTARVVLGCDDGDSPVAATYQLAPGDFWITRRLSIGGEPVSRTIDSMVYGNADLPGVAARSLSLGKFDRPRIIAAAGGGLFVGVEHWFYSVNERGAFMNAKIDWPQDGEFVAEPFYVGVFANDAHEPYPGWSGYRAYLDRSTAAARKHTSWFSWNAGWGQWGIDIDDPSVPAYLGLMKQVGIDGITFGSGGVGKGIDGFIRLAADDATSQKNIAELRARHIAGGTLNNGAKKWDDASSQAGYRDELDAYAAAGFRSTAFDFFSSPDTYAAHRRVADYFRAAQTKLDYTECHLGMAAYGPQFQKLVQVNHPNDIHGFDIAHFSADWATFLAFRQSRREWQNRYDYLMPENGLYYFLTHYSNWGNPRRYTDPEPQQFLWRVPAYCGIGFNFHDTFGWREVIAASSAFTTCPVFGHIDLRMPQRDVDFARRFLAWERENAPVLRPARVCAETDDYSVISKFTGDKGLIHIVIYRPGTRHFELKLRLGESKPLSIRQVYPLATEPRILRDGAVLSMTVRGESSAILEINGALKTLPPTNASRFPIDLPAWEATDQHTWKTTFDMPDIRESLKNAVDHNLPRELLSLDQVQETQPQLPARISPDGSANLKSAVEWLGKGKLPPEFANVCRFSERQTVPTWKAVPWAYADRVWFVLRPKSPLPLTGPRPTMAVNGQPVELIPRVDHRFDQVELWNCPLYYADITGLLRFGDRNDLVLSGIDTLQAYVTSAADRE